MPSILAGYEYDIFISYRQNDNKKDRWVSNFVQALKEELEATLKNPVSIYFDENPHDGLLETHQVGASLETKLKCLVLIPIVSQTYCDTSSFAWQHEFLPFNKMAREDESGMNITLKNGNDASRVLPVQIHELDSEDQLTIENELEGPLRSIKFIHQAAGINRPLAEEDDRLRETGKILYSDQINKVANALKELGQGLLRANDKTDENVNSDKSAPMKPRRLPIKIVSILVAVILLAFLAYLGFRPKSDSPTISRLASIAVLPFKDLSPEGDQEYLGDGIAEGIINVLAKIDGIKVIGRTSSFSFKGENDDLVTIGSKLGVGTLLEGSVRKSGNRIRITAQLINTEDGSHFWSDVYERELDDIFIIQDEISEKIANKFKLTRRLSREEAPPTRNIEAYEMYLKGLQSYAKGLVGTKIAVDHMEKATELDPDFLIAYTNLADMYWATGLYELDSPEESFKRARNAALKAIQIDPSDFHGYLELSKINFYVDWDWALGYDNFDKAIDRGLPIPDRYDAYFQSIVTGGGDKPIEIAKKLLKNDPFSVNRLLDLSRMYLNSRRFKDVIDNGQKIMELNPENSSVKRHMGAAYLFSGNLPMALQFYGELMEKDSTYAPHGYIGALVKMDRKKEAWELLNRLPKSITPYKLAICYLYLNELDSTFTYLEKAYNQRNTYMAFIKVEPHFDSIKEDPRFLAILKRMNFPED